MAENFMSFEYALEKIHKAARMVRAAGARENGVFDDPELQKLGPLDIGSGVDVLRIMGPATRMYHDLCTALDVVEDYIVNHCADDSDLTDGVDECPRGRKCIDENDPICGACEFFNDCELPAGGARMVLVDRGFAAGPLWTRAKVISSRTCDNLFDEGQSLQLLVELPGGERTWVDFWKELPENV